MVCYCLPICCSCGTEPQPIPTPDSFPEPNEKVLCPRCGVIGPAEYCQTQRYCVLCFCLPCSCGHSEPFLSCKNCKYDLSKESIHKCDKCNISYTFRSQYCPECGKKN